MANMSQEYMFMSHAQKQAGSIVLLKPYDLYAKIAHVSRVEFGHGRLNSPLLSSIKYVGAGAPVFH